MPFDIQISLQKFLTGLIVVIVPLSVVGLYLTSNADSSLQQTVGMHFRIIAQTDAAAASQFIRDRIIDVSAIAVDDRGAVGYPKLRFPCEGYDVIARFSLVAAATHVEPTVAEDHRGG